MLRTEIKKGGVSSPEGYFLDEAHLDFADGRMLLHDAAYAHALVTAIAEIESLGPYEVRTKYNGEEMIQSIRGIACRLMNEWGFEEKVTP